MTDAEKAALDAAMRAFQVAAVEYADPDYSDFAGLVATRQAIRDLVDGMLAARTPGVAVLPMPG